MTTTSGVLSTNLFILFREFRDFDFLSPWEGMQSQMPIRPNVTMQNKRVIVRYG